MKNAFSISSTTVAALIILSAGALPVLAGPSGTPTSGNVDPKFSTLTVGTGSPAGFKADATGVLSNPDNTKPFMITDAQGLLVTAGGGNLAVSSGGNVSNSGNLDVGNDADVNGDATAFNVNAWSTAQAPFVTSTYHMKGVEIGKYTWSKFIYSTINAGAAKNYPSSLPSTFLTCPQGNIAVACNYAAYSDVANCGSGNPSVQSNNVVATKIMLEPQGGGWGVPKSGGYCNATLKNTGATQICGMVSVECWDPNG